MTVSIYAESKPELAMTLSQQNFYWLMGCIGLGYTYESQAMLPAEVLAAVANFRHKYCYIADSRVSPDLYAEKVAAWNGLLQGLRSPAPIMAQVAEALGVDDVAGPDWSNLGDPFQPGTQAYALQDRLSGYLTHLGQMAKYCIRQDEVILLS